MNELQVKITADIAALQSAFNQVKKTVKQFADETENSTDKLGNGVKKDIGLVQNLENELKRLRKAQKDAFTQEEVERYNQELEKTTQELTRLNALGRTLGNASTGAAGGINKLATAQGNANGVAIEFNRIIQDAPFGVIGIGNNIQQLTQSFGSLSKSAGGAGAAIKASLSALISPANLAVLAISALTAGFTAYQMGAFDGLFATEDLTEATEKYRDSLSSLTKVQFDALKNADDEIITLNSLRSIIESETTSREQKNAAIERLQKEYPSYFGNLTKEQILAGGLQKTYEALTKTLIARATAESAIQKIVDLQDEERVLLEKTASVREQIDSFEQKALKNRLAGQEQLAVINENQVRFLENQNPELQRLAEIEAERNQLTESINTNLAEANVLLGGSGGTEENLRTINTEAEKLKRTFEDIRNLPNIGLPGENRDDLARRLRERNRQLNEGGQVGATGQEFIDAELQKIIEQGIIIPENLADNFETQAEQIQARIDDLGQSFTGLGTLIGSAFKNPQLGTFLGQFLQFASKLIAANFKISTASAIASASQSAAATGPGAVFTLPAFIAGAVGLIASAFAGIKGGGGGSVSGGGSVGIPQTFTNANASVPGSFNPDLAGFGSGFSTSGGKLTAEVSGDSLIFVLERAQEKRSRS